MYTAPVPKRHYSVSVLIPAYNEEKSIKETLESVLQSDYSLEEIIVINDGSTDKTKEIVEKMMQKHSIIKILNKKNSGKADSLNKGIEIAKSELFVVIDSDGFPQKEAIGKMVGFFDDEKIAAVTSTILARNRDKFVTKLQAMEYAAIAWTRKLLEYVDGIWVTPGPLSMYRMEVVKKIGGFDTQNLTEDIEIAWRLVHNGYKIRMAMPSRVLTVVPEKMKIWAKQRIRWNVGGIQTLLKYKKEAFKKGLGAFIIPFFSINMFLGLFGLCVFTSLLLKNLWLRFAILKYSAAANINPLVINKIYFTPTILNIFGIALFVLGFYFAVFSFSQMKENEFMRKRNILTLFFYLIAYLSLYPILLLVSIYKIATGKTGWGTK